MSDLETRLVAIGELLPDPDERATADGRRAMHAARASAPWATGRRRSWFSSRGPRTYLVAAALALVIGGGALAAAWSLGDVPAFGRDPEQAFVAPRTDILPGGYERSRPTRMAELPSRPSLRCPKGTTYTQAIAAYFAARQRGEVVPPGAELAAPLPDGKVVLVEGGRVSLDPAAPIGFNPATGLVGVLSAAPAGPIAIARCEVLLGDDPDSGSCGDGTRLRFISEGVAGRWLPSEVGGIQIADSPLGRDVVSFIRMDPPLHTVRRRTVSPIVGHPGRGGRKRSAEHPRPATPGRRRPAGRCLRRAIRALLTEPERSGPCALGGGRGRRSPVRRPRRADGGMPGGPRKDRRRRLYLQPGLATHELRRRAHHLRPGRRALPLCGDHRRRLRPRLG